MTISVEVPSLGESVSEAIIANWLKQEGDYVEEDEIIAELDTDKISVDVPAPAAGVITSLKYDLDADVAVGEVIAEIDTDAEKPAGGAGEADEETAEDEKADSDEADAPADDEGAVELSPAVARLVEQYDLEAGDIAGSGPDGRLTKGDVLDYIDEHDIEEAAEAKTDKEPAPERPETLVRREGQEVEERVKMSSLRQTVAKRLVDVQNDTAMLTTFQEVDMSSVIELRKSWQDRFTDQYETKLGFMSFFVKACIDALKRFPAVNAQIDDDEIVYKNYYHVGVAVGGPDGLVVPVLKHADQLSFADTELAIQEKVDKVFDKDLTLDDLQGGTFTISNGGIYGSMLSTPILNPPQSAILGMHNIVDRPVAIDGEVVIRPMMYLALSYDHRIIDGKEAVTFLKRIKECIENPERMLLEV
jgi:2-oxoglutarate dehydrogenase E2 component (dihydrolipoamide succinyltransferase)